MWTNRPPIQRTMNTPPQGQRDLPPSLVVNHLPPPLNHSRTSSSGQTSPGGQLTPTSASSSTPSSVPSSQSTIINDENGNTNHFTDLTRPDDGTALVDLVRRLSWDGGNSCASSEMMSCGETVHDDHDDSDVVVLPSSMTIDVSMYPAPTLSTQPPSPILAAMQSQAQAAHQHHQHQLQQQHQLQHQSTTTVLFEGNLNTAHLQPIRTHSHQHHRKVASCPFQLAELIHTPLLATSSPHGSPPHDKSVLAQASLSNVFSSSISGSGSPSGRSSPSTSGLASSGRFHSHSLLFHPYERDRDRSGGGSNGGSGGGDRIMAAMNGGSSIPHCSPTGPILSGIGGFNVAPSLSTTSSTPTSIHHRPTVISPASRFLSRKLATLPAALVLAKAARATSPPPPSNSPGGYPPPLSLSITSMMHEHQYTSLNGSNMFGHMYGSGCGSSPVSAGGAGTIMASWDGTPPASPQPRLNGMNGLALPHSNAFRTPTSSPSTRPTNLSATARGFMGQNGAILMNDSPAFAPSSPMGDAVSMISASSSVSSAGLHIGMATGASGGGGVIRRSSYSLTTTMTSSGSTCSSPSASSSESPLIRPDFSAFDGSGAWTRLSSHSPAKHRSLPGTPLHRPHQGYSVPPTPNARLAKQARSRRSSAGQDAATAGRNILDAPILMIDYDALATPPCSLPLNVALQSNAFAESVFEQEELGSGSFGDVYKVRLTNKPFVYLFGSANTAATNMTTTPETGSNLQHIYAYKRMRSPFAVLHERTRMLKKYTAIFEMVQNLRQASVLALQSHHHPSSPSTADDALLLLAPSYLDPVTFFPRHMVHHSYVWQEHGKLHVLMELCSRGDLTTYWSVLSQDELDRIRDSVVPHAHAVGSSNESNFALDDDHMSAGSDEIFDAPRPPLSPLSEKVVWRLLLEIGSALALMHSQNCLHLDVKPANIFVTESEQFKLGDFDSCVLIRRPSPGGGGGTQSPTPSHHALAGIPGAMLPIRVPNIPGFSQELDALEEGDGLWCAPELLQSMQHATDRADIYSLGASIYSVLNDEIVRRDDVTGERTLTFQHLKCPISTVLHQTITQMTHTAQTNRPTAIELMTLATRMLQDPVPESELKLHWMKT